MDRLSHLHPSVRSHIVSFLPTEDAMKLAILSSYWRNIISSLSDLTFSKHSKDKKTFRDCIDRALVSHDETDIQCFDNLDRFDDNDINDDDDDGFTESDFSRWITILVQHNILYLDLRGGSTKPTSLPCFLFTCSTLVRLVLVKIKLPEIPPLIRLPNLKTFGLRGVCFGDVSKDILSLSFPVSSFPALLALQVHTRQQIRSLSISTPRLIYFDLHTVNSPGLTLSISTLGDVQFFHEGLPVDISTIEISAETVSSITSAVLQMDWYSETSNPSSTSHNASKIFFGLRCMKELFLSVSFIEFLCWDRSFHRQTQAISISLKKLTLQMFRAKKDHVKMVKFLTWSLPQLETLSISVLDIPEEMEGVRETKLLVGDDIVMIPHLRTIEMDNFVGEDNELELARHFLATATTLEEMNISFSVDTDVDTRKRVDLNLMSSPKVSRQVVGLVYDKK